MYNMKIKMGITVIAGERPYLLQVAIPDGVKFRYGEFKYKSGLTALSVLAGYFHSYKKEPKNILEYHLAVTEAHNKQVELPFSGM